MIKFRTGRHIAMFKTFFCGAALFCAASCVYIDESLGENFIPANMRFAVKTAEFDLNDISMKMSDSLSAYSSIRITIGAIRDDVYGLSTRSSAFALVPIADTIDFGKNPVVRQFHFNATKDTVSCKDESQKNIIQNINVYELEHEIDSTYLYTNKIKKSDFKGKPRITNGVPLYSGGDTLSFDFTKEFASKYIPEGGGVAIYTDVDEYIKQHPGIFISTDEPLGNGGRINMFGVALKYNDSYYITGDYAELKIKSDYGDRKGVDTSFVFYFGPVEKKINTDQHAFNICEHSTEALAIQATDKIYVEGGGGLKPVISSKEIKETILSELTAEGLSPENVVINKASIVLPFEMPEDYVRLDAFPKILSPTIKQTVTDNSGDLTMKYVSFAGLTDTSSSTENIGGINRYSLNYTPDISHHVQAIIGLGEDADYNKYDIWMMVMAKETIETSKNDDLSDYYNNLAYASYYNNIYDPYGYGGYGYGYGGYGYGGYGGYYNNYLNYAMASQYASSGTQSTTNTMIDKDRYYFAVLNGPESVSSKPKLTITYSFIKQTEE